MKILFASPHFPPRFIGGVEIYTKRLADAFLALGDRPEVVCVEGVDASASGVAVTTDTSPGYPVHRVSGPVVQSGGPLSVSFESEKLRRALDGLLEASRPDVIHLHSGYLLGGELMSAAFDREIPIAVTLHDFWFICPRITLLHPSGRACTGPASPAKCTWCLATAQRRFRLVDELIYGGLGTGHEGPGRRAVVTLFRQADALRLLETRRVALAAALDRASLVFSPSHFLKAQMVQAGVRADRIQVARLGIEKVVRPRQRAGDGPLRVAFLGQLAPHKGVHLLVDAVRRIPDARLTLEIHGDPTRDARYSSTLERAAAGDPRIGFAGPYRHDSVYDILGSVDVIVLPSTWYENSPLVIQEAFMAGVPVVASRLGGMKELVLDEQNGLTFEPGNAQDLARQLRRLVDEPGLLARLAPDPDSVRSTEHEVHELRTHYARLHRDRVPEGSCV